MSHMIELDAGIGPSVVIFDWDGTLYDADFLFDSAVEKVLRDSHQHGALARVESILYRERGTPLRRSLRLPMEGRAELVRAIGQEFVALEEQATLFPGIAEVLQDLLRRGCKLGVVTGSRRKRFDDAVRKTELFGIFESTVCGEETPAKPSPAGIQRVLSDLKVASPNVRTVYVGNQVDDATAALNAGIGFVGVCFCARTRSSGLVEANLACCPDVRSLDMMLMAHGA